MVQSPVVPSPDPALPLDQTLTDLARANSPVENQHLKRSFPQGSITSAPLQKMTAKHDWVERNNPAHI